MEEISEYLTDSSSTPSVVNADSGIDVLVSPVVADTEMERLQDNNNSQENDEMCAITPRQLQTTHTHCK